MKHPKASQLVEKLLESPEAPSTDHGVRTTAPTAAPKTGKTGPHQILLKVTAWKDPDSDSEVEVSYEMLGLVTKELTAGEAGAAAGGTKPWVLHLFANKNRLKKIQDMWSVKTYMSRPDEYLDFLPGDDGFESKMVELISDHIDHGCFDVELLDRVPTAGDEKRLIGDPRYGKTIGYGKFM